MNIQKIFTYFAYALGFIGLILQVIILNQGDDIIKLNALSGNYGVVNHGNLIITGFGNHSCTDAGLLIGQFGI